MGMFKAIRSFLGCTFLLITCVFGQAPDTSLNYNVKNFGARGDGKQLDHKAINKAIENCYAHGGGTVYIPAGKYLCGSIRLKSNINLYIDAGAVIVGAPADSNAYDSPEAFTDTAYQDGGHTYFHNSLIWGEHLSNVSITGRGMIDGGGLTKMDTEHEGDLRGGSIGTGDKAIALKLCNNVLIRDITIFHGGHFAIILTGCDLTTLDNLTIDTNRDGIDIDCCTNTLVSNCKVNSPGDDAICPKSSYALNKPVLTENLIITNCQVSAFEEGTLLDGRRIPRKVSKMNWSGGRIKFGTESNGGFRNCVVSNCTFWYCNGLALEVVDGGTMDNIVVSNITMQHVNCYPIYVTLGQRNRGPKATTKMGVVKNITISNIYVIDADNFSGIQLTGMPGYPLENITLHHINIQYRGGGTKAQGEMEFPELGKGYPEPYVLGTNPAYGLYARHIKALQLYDITFNTIKQDDRPGVICHDIKGLDIDRMKMPETKGNELFKFKDVTHLTIDGATSVAKTLLRN
ncbi:MAG: glycoside hydrolase family 28 protein [Mucilaginibacter sp.]